MTDNRVFLPAGTTVELDYDLYEITGEPIGCGGGSILYPAQKKFMLNGVLQTDGIQYVLKECYPAASGYAYTRADNGEIIPVNKNAEDMRCLQQAQLMQLEEERISKNIYRTASRMLPIRKSAQSVALTLPDRKKSSMVPNTVTLMDSLAEKGRSITAWVRQKRRFAPAEAFRIIQQVLFALQEVHEAGYLHLDIQDGNIFLRGTLEQKNEMVTLIDFGCARKLINGKTAPIRNKVIFTTQGFSAPEILLHNDGDLQLGPEADIYSVGCLALYLLTGQRANIRELIANRTGVYLRSNQLRRISCPKHLIDTMQRILARALAKEPENRYRSVKEMLDEVTPLTEALQPKPTIFGAVKYDAFVCYKHGTVDSAAALALQRALENYRAPKGAGDKRKPFGRVFVDEGELSSCADFGQQIREALKNSAWLIVICSPDTPLSPWVQLEIDTFLEHHDRSRILAVLTGGTPEVSFPPQLKGDIHGAGEVFAAHALSSSPQEAEKKLKGDALLKIAAPMLGTTYDTLKQRHKIYRLQRAAAITAGFLLVSAGFAAYAMNRAKVIAEQAARIEEEYERSLINESLFLAEQAEKKLADNDPLGAMELALQALPSEKQDRPVLPEAEYALGKALGIYRTPSAAEDTATPVGRIDTDCPYFFLSTDGRKLFAWDDSVDGFGSKIQCWNTENLSMLWEVFLDHGIFTHPFTSSDGGLYVMGYHSVCCMDAGTGSERWSVDIANAKAMALSQDASELLVISEGDADEDDQNGDAQLRLTATVLNAGNGAALNRKHIDIDGDMRVEGTVCVSPDLQFAAIPTVDNSSQNFTWHSCHALYLADLAGETSHKLLDSQTEICDMFFTEDALALIRGNGYTLTTQHNVLYEYNAQYTYWMELFDIQGCSLVWQQEITDHFETGGVCKILQTDYDDGSETGQGLLYIFDDHCVLLDQKEGRILRQYRLSAAAVDVSLTETGFETVNTDGSYTAAAFSMDTVLNIQYFSPVISEAYQMEDMFFVQNETLTDPDHTICQYQLNRFDDSYVMHFVADSNSWREYRGGIQGDSDNVLLINRNQVCLTDLSTGETWQHTVPEGYGFSEYRITAVDADKGCLYWSETGHWDDPECWVNNSRYYMLDFATGQITELIQPLRPHEYINSWDVIFADDMALVAATWYTDQQDYLSVYAWDLTNGTLSELWKHALLPAPDGAEGASAYLWENYLQGSLVYNSEKKQVCFALYENYSEILTKLICVNTDTRAAKEISVRIMPEEGKSARESWGRKNYHWNASETQAVFTCNDRILVADLGGIICDIPVTEQIASLQYSPDERCILTVSQSGVLSRYRIEDSAFCASVNLAEHCSSLYTVYADDWTWEFLDDSTLLIVSNFGGFLMDISEETVKMKAIADQCIGYDPANDRLIAVETDSYSGKHTTIGSFRRYTVQDLIKKANAMLNR